jgi:UDPglucose 6-dehydrogenase
VHELAVGVGLDDRIGPRFLTAGPGFGGSCFPKDLVALIKTANDYGSPVEIVETVIRANDRHKQLMVRKIRTALGGSVSGRRIGVLGLAFKANTDDMRNAPALTIVAQLLTEGATVKAFDPAAGEQAKSLLPDLLLTESIEETVAGVDCVVILTEWSEFKSIAWHKLAPKMRRPLLIDLRNICEPKDILRQGIEYVAIGRPVTAPSFSAAAE